MTAPPNDPRGRDGYHDRDAHGVDGRPVDREVYVERDRMVAPPQEEFATTPKPNPGAGALLVLGGLMAVLSGLIPAGGGKIPLAGAFDLFKMGGTEAFVYGAAILLVFLCGLGALAAGSQMFAPKWHAGPSRTGMTMGILMLIASLAVVIVVGSGVFDNAGLATWLMLLACIPTIIGALVGFARK